MLILIGLQRPCKNHRKINYHPPNMLEICYCSQSWPTRKKKLINKHYLSEKYFLNRKSTTHALNTFLSTTNQRSAMNRFFTTHKYSWNFGYEWVKSIEIQQLGSTLIYKSRLQQALVQRWHQTHNNRNMFDSYEYSFRFIDLEKYL